MKTKISCVYKIICLYNNKIYIGQTLDYIDRINHHKNKLKRNCDDNPYLQNDYNKYGLNNFEFKIIEECLPNNLLERETYWINYYGGKDSDSLYNIQDLYGFNKHYCMNKQGSNNVMYHKTHTDEVKQLLHNINTGKVLSLEHRNKISQGLKRSACHNNENNQKRREALTKYDQNFIQALREEYSIVKNYTKIANKYKLQPAVVSNLIKYGTTSSTVIKKLK